MIAPRLAEAQLAELMALQILPGRLRTRRVADNLRGWVAAAEALGVPRPEAEFHFHPLRRWRFDLAWPAYLIAVEREGGVGRGLKSRHKSADGFEGDAVKYGEAQARGWQVLRVTPRMLKSGEAMTLLLRMFGLED